MSKELVISSTRHETKVAILEDDQLVEIFFQRANEYSLAGSIHKGRVTRVLPGMQSAFVDLGLERDTFLYVSDFFEDNEEYDRIGADEKPGRGDRDRGDRDRGDRERVERERPERERAERERPERVAVQGAGSSRVQEVPAPEPVSEPAAAASATETAPPPPRTEEGFDPRERRGRRGRRRRGRGRGFPESKYAEVTAGQPAPAPAAEERQESDQLPPIVLPGESLAKYTRSASGWNGQGGAASAESGMEEEDRSETAEMEEERAQEGLEAVEPAVGSAFPESSYVLPQVPVPLEAIEQAAEEEEAGEEAEETAEPIELEDPLASEVLDSDVEEEEAAAEAAESPEEEAAPAPGGEGTALRAEVRERGGRFLHRGGSRRMRRGGRMRGGERRQEGETAEALPKPERSTSQPQSISELLREGQEIIVQIAKEPLGQKGARITSHIALPGRYCVFMPTLDHLGVSRKVSSEEERTRLKRILQAHKSNLGGGFIVRTAGEGRSEEEIASDMAFLYNLWLDIRQKAEKKPAPVLLHHDLDIVERILRDQLTDSFKTVWLDNEEMYESVLSFVQRFQPALVGRVKLYTRETPIFDAFHITSELEKALRPKVWLKSGGYIVINQTEALVAIDVNTGKFVGKSNRLEDTIVKTNTEAVKEIARQMRLRDLGGIIVVDFIDMDERKNRQKVMQAFEEAMRGDRAPYKILQFNDFGLVAITRKRVKQSLERTLCSACPTCEGSGYVKSVQTVVSEILVEAQKIRKAVDGPNVVLRTNPDVARYLKSNENKYLEEIEEVLGRPVLVKGDATIHPEKFDLA